jgi:hypothetical protein
MYEVCGEKEFKVLLALDPGDSISGVARKIDENRETIRRVVNCLEEAGYVVYDDGLQFLDQTIRDVGLDFLTAAAATSPPSIPEAYVLPQFAGMDYAFTAIDAVYVWTRGGYQVAREPDDYPLFIAVHESDFDAWTVFFDRFGIPTAEERQPADEFDGGHPDRSRAPFRSRGQDGRRTTRHPAPRNRGVRKRILRNLRVRTRHTRPDVRRCRYRCELSHGACVNYPTLLSRRIRASVLEGWALMWTPGNQSPAIRW